MSSTAELPAWIALFLGLYSLAAAVGELRAPGSWMAMVEDLEQSHAARFLTGIICLAVGAALYLAVPWQSAAASGDWLAVAVSVLGGLIVAEGLIFLAAGDRILALSRRMMGSHTSLWAGFAAVFGAGVLFVALSRLQVA